MVAGATAATSYIATGNARVGGRVNVGSNNRGGINVSNPGVFVSTQLRNGRRLEFDTRQFGGNRAGREQAPRPHILQLRHYNPIEGCEDMRPNAELLRREEKERAQKTFEVPDVAKYDFGVQQVQEREYGAKMRVLRF